MREIKFRIWDKETKRMNPDKVIAYWVGEQRNVMMQYTGLKDKNGKEIYEGDILRLENEARVYWVVEQDNRNDFPRGFTMTATYPQYIHPDVKETHIIGNIYENPKLIASAGQGD